MRASVLCAAVWVAACSAPHVEPLPEIDWRPRMIGEGGGVEPAHVAAGSYPIDLDNLLALAGTRPLEIEMARAQMQEAIGAETVAVSQWIPTIKPTLTFNRHEGADQSTPGIFLNVDKQNTYAGVGISLQLNIADAYFDTLSAAQRTRASELGMHAAQQVNVGHAVQLYYDLIQAQASLQIAAEAVEHARELVAIEETRQRAGRSLEAQVLRARAFLSSIEGRQAQVEASVRQIGALLSALLLLPEGFELVSVEEDIVAIEFPEAALTLPELLQRALSARPDLEQARTLSQVADTERDQAAYSWLVPELRADAAFAGFGENLSSLEDRQDYFVGVQWDLTWGSVGRARMADARHRQAKIRVDSLENQIRAELQGAVARLRAARLRIAAAGREVESARASLELTRAHNRQGDALLVEVLDAERASIEAAAKKYA